MLLACSTRSEAIPFLAGGNAKSSHKIKRHVLSTAQDMQAEKEKTLLILLISAILLV